MMDANKIVLLGIATTSFVLLCGSQSSCDRRTPTLTCDAPTVVVAPGTCVALDNPCADRAWGVMPAVDGFSLCDAPAGITAPSVRASVQVGNETRLSLQRQLCAGPEAAVGAVSSVGFIFERRYEVGVGTLQVVVAEPLVVGGATASPSSLAAGASTQLSVQVSGGVPPYRYAWTASDGLYTSDAAAPVATPSASTVYTVRVTDAMNTARSATVEVTVTGPEEHLTVIAIPAELRPGFGDFVELYAEGPSAPQPYTWRWTPADSVLDATVPDTFASPSVTTTYTVTRTDATGRQLTGSVTVTVMLDVRAFASPQFISIGQSSNLSLSIAGGDGQYSYNWTPVESLSSPTSPAPIASPTVTTDYTLHVTDGHGARASANVRVNVLESPPPALTASFAYVFNGVETLRLNAEASTGFIAQYDYTFSWAPGVTISSATPTAVYSATPSTVGTITLTVTDIFGNRASSTVGFP